MPTVRVMSPQGAWAKEEKAIIVESLTEGVSEAAEGGCAIGGAVIA